MHSKVDQATMQLDPRGPASIPCAVLRRQVSTYFVSEAVEKRAQDLPLALGFKECSRTTCLALGFDGPYRFAQFVPYFVVPTVPFPSPFFQDFLCKVFLHFQGSKLIELKRLIDAAGGGRDLRHCVYSVITSEADWGWGPWGWGGW